MGLDLFEETTALLAELERREVAYAVAGAVALAIHGAPRATSDLDLLVPADAVATALEVARARGFTLEALPMRFGDGMQVRRVTKVEGDEALTLDLLLVDQNTAAVWDSRMRVPTAEGGLWVVSREGLIRMKVWAGRPQDLADVRRLEELDR